jgi:hypothetical protein
MSVKNQLNLESSGKERTTKKLKQDIFEFFFFLKKFFGKSWQTVSLQSGHVQS